MREQLINFETAKLAKEKGFKVEGYHLLYIEENTKESYLYELPSQSLVQKWLREEHGIIVFASHETIDDAESAWTWTIKIHVPEGVEGTRKKKEYDFWKWYGSFGDEMMWWKTYEEAIEQGLFKALKKIK